MLHWPNHGLALFQTEMNIPAKITPQVQKSRTEQRILKWLRIPALTAVDVESILD